MSNTRQTLTRFLVGVAENLVANLAIILIPIILGGLLAFPIELLESI